MKTKIKSILFATVIASATFSIQSCSLDENNPGGFTMENMAINSLESYQTLLNQCYFGMQRFLYGTDGYMELTEGDTDLWTYRGNVNTSYTQYFWFFAGAAPNTTYTNGYWNSMYDGIGSCNMAIALAEKAPFKSEEAKNRALAEARFCRAVYYFNTVEQFGGCVMLTAPATSMDFAPVRTEPMTIYKEVIIPDLEFAVEWLDKGDHSTLTTPTKKAALGMLAKACLQTKYYGTDEYLALAQEAANKLIKDCEAGGATYGAYMYTDYKDVFAEANNMQNKEALWKHAWYAGSDNHGSSNGNYKLNRYDEKFLCSVTSIGAIQDTQEQRLSWDDCRAGLFMPTQHLLNLFVQPDGSLDPRFDASFTTEWKANKDYTWDNEVADNFRKDGSVVEGKTIASGDLAIRFAMPQDDDYADVVAEKATCNYLLVDYKDVYNDTKKNVIMELDGNESKLKGIYPSLNKHNSSNYYVANANKKRNGNLNAVLIMRMAEVYLIAAELDIYLNGGANAMNYINKVRTRAGATSLSGTATVRTVLDERARELCGEHTRFIDLKRTGMFKDASYLQETHPDLAQFFKPEYALRPISTTYTAGITNGAEWQNPGY